VNILIVDDSRERQEAFYNKFSDTVFGTNTFSLAIVYQATDYDQAIKALQTIQVDILFLDHDLGKDSKTGYDLAVWMEEQEALGNINLPRRIYIHSMNPVGARNIQKVFPTAILCPGAWQSVSDNPIEE
jgi:CheY-like chemotaxis protein